MEVYGEDLAYLHDTGWRDFALRAIPRVLAELDAAGVAPGSLVVELGCGSGLVARALTDAGYAVLGSDISPAMIELARRAAPDARLAVGSWVDFEIPPCAAVLAISEVLQYTDDPERQPADLRALLGRVRDALAPGGPLVFDLSGPGREPTRLWQEGEDWLIGVETGIEGNVLTRRMTTFREVSGGCYRRGSETHVQRLCSEAEVLGLLRATGFEAHAEIGYDGTEFVPGHRAYFGWRTS